MKFTVDCVGTGRGWRYRVTLWCGRLKYVGESDYARHEDAMKAGRATGAVPKEEEVGAKQLVARMTCSVHS